MMRVDIHFETGRDILGAYWGHLSHGGLAIHPSRDSEPEGVVLDKGQEVTLCVHVGGQREVSVQGHVAHVGNQGTLVAFDTDDSQSQLLIAALSERALDIEVEVESRKGTGRAAVSARLSQLSEDGCCLRLDSAHDELFDVGSEIFIEAPQFRIGGCVVLAHGTDRCVIFGLDDDDDTNSAQAVAACFSQRSEASGRHRMPNGSRRWRGS